MVAEWPTVNKKGGQLSVFQERLREERKRMDLNQSEFGALGGVSKDAQLNYEKGLRSPDANYLSALVAHGVDVFYLLTGESSGKAVGDLTAIQVQVLDFFAQISAGDHPAVLAVLQAFAMKGAGGRGR